jgi:phage gpG-like protein
MIQARLIGMDKVSARVGTLFFRIADRLEERMKPFVQALQGYVRSQKLQGGHPLHQRTGDLSRSIKAHVERDAKAVSGYVYSEGARDGTPVVPYARIHEFGGTVHVPAHERLQSYAWGRPIEPRMVRVRAYNAVYPERSFLRSSLSENRARFEQLVRDCVKEAVA